MERRRLNVVNEVIGDLITFPANIIVHQTNFDGIMGGGVAYYIANSLLSSGALHRKNVPATTS